MANQKLTAIRTASPYASPLANDDLFYLVQDTATTPDERAITAAELKTAVLSLPASILQRLDGAGTWNIEVVYKSADETVNNSSTIQNDDALKWATVASAVYGFEMTIFVTGVDTTADFKCGWAVPASTTMLWNRNYGYNGAATGGSPDAILTAGSTDAVGSINGTFGIKYSGTVITAATTGDVQFKWAQNTAGATNLKVLAGSYIRFFRLA